MGLIETLDRLQRIDDLLTRKATGNPKSFADKLGISKRRLYVMLEELREYGLKIEYSKERQTYYYLNDQRIFSNNLDQVSRKYNWNKQESDEG